MPKTEPVGVACFDLTFTVVVEMSNSRTVALLSFFYFYYKNEASGFGVAALRLVTGVFRVVLLLLAKA